MDAEITERLDSLVAGLKRRGVLHDSRLAQAFRSVPRHLFLPDVDLDQVYQDQAIVTRRRGKLPISSSSQPAMMAIMLERLGLQPGQRVMEIGAGTGYNAALLAFMLGRRGRVVSLDIDADIVEQARENLQALPARARAQMADLVVLTADGGEGLPEHAPYDAIIVTVGAWDIPPAWLDQLKSGGRLVVPLWFNGAQLCLTLQRVQDHLESISVDGCGFMRMRGKFSGPEAFYNLDEKGLLSATLDAYDVFDAAQLRGLLTQRSFTDYPSGVQLTPRLFYQGLDIWISLQETGLVSIFDQNPAGDAPVVPYLFGSREKFVVSRGILRDESLCLLMRPPQTALPGAEAAQERSGQPFELYVRSFGADESLAADLLERIWAWQQAGRPTWESLRMQVYPVGASLPADAAPFRLRKRWMQYIWQW